MPTLRHLTQGAQCKLYHQRLGHPGERAMKTIHLHVDGIPKLKANAFYKCASCLHAKMKQRAFNHTQSGTPSRTITADEDKVECGQSFNVDYGFMKGSGYCSKDVNKQDQERSEPTREGNYGRVKFSVKRSRKPDIL